MNTSKKNSVLVIGAGASGLTLGFLLSQKGFRVTLLEKSGGVGGRIATRRWEHGQWNHGISCIDKTDIPEPIWKVWSGALIKSPALGDSKYLAPLGLTQIAKLLANELNIQKKRRVVRFEFLNASTTWRVFDDSQQEFFADFLVLTCPAPQMLELLQASNFVAESEMGETLSAIRYRPHLVALAFIESPCLKTLESPFESCVENSGFVTFYLNEDFSRSRWNKSDEEVLTEVSGHLEKLKIGTIKHIELKRWRYSNCLNPSSTPFISAPEPYGLYAIGDAFSDGGLHGAINSAMQLAESFAATPDQHLKSSLN